jgi:hypothetical protein
MEDMLQAARTHAPSRRGAPSVPVTPSLTSTSDARLARTTDTPTAMVEVAGDEPVAAISEAAPAQSEVAPPATWILARVGWYRGVPMFWTH